MKKVLFYSLIFLFVVSALVLPMSYKDAYAAKTITVYQVTHEGQQFGSYTISVDAAEQLMNFQPRSEEPRYTIIGSYVDLQWTSLMYTTIQQAYNQGFLYVYYAPNTFVNYFYVLDGSVEFMFSRYAPYGGPTAPDSDALSNYIPSGYKIYQWYSSSSLSDEFQVPVFPGANGEVSLDFYAKLVEDIPQVTVTVYLSLNNQIQQFYATYGFDVGEAIDLPSPYFQNYGFSSWHSGYPCNSNNIIYNLGQASQDIVLYALMIPTNVTLNIYWTDTANGSPYLAHTIQVPYNKTPIMTPYLTRDGYALIKVTSDPQGNNNLNGVYGPLTKNTDFYAFFSQAVQVSYFTASVNGSLGDFVTSMSVGVGSQAPYVSIPTIEGYRFIGYAVGDPFGTIVAELPVISAPTTIYIMYSYAITEGSSLFIYTISFNLDDSYTLIGGPRQDSSQPSYRYIDVMMYLTLTLDDVPQYYTVTNVVSNIDNTKQYFSDDNGIGYRDVVVVSYNMPDAFVFKFLSFKPIESFDGKLSLLFNAFRDDISDTALVYNMPLRDYHVTSQEITMGEDLFYLIQQPPVYGNDKGVLTVVGGFFNSVGRFFLKITTYEIFGIFPLYLLIALSVMLVIVIRVIRSFI